jgi:hypothetical protein
MGNDSEDFDAGVRADVQQALHAMRTTLTPYLEPFSPEELQTLGMAFHTPGPRATPLPAADSDLGRLHAQLVEMSGRMAPHRFLDDLHAELKELLLALEGTLLLYGARKHDIEPSLQQSTVDYCQLRAT